MTISGRPPRGTGFRRLIAAVAASAAILVTGIVPGGAAAEPRLGGAALLAQLQSGRTTCGAVTAGDFTLVGEYVMGQMMGSAASYTAMNAEMLSRSGARSERLAYRFLGERLGGCARGTGPVSFGTMMSVMGTSMLGASYGSTDPAGPNGSSMMDGYGSRTSGTDWGVVAAVALGVVVLLGLTVVVFQSRRRSI